MSSDIIDDFMRGGYCWKDRRRAKNNRCCRGVRHRSQRCFTAVGKSFKTTGTCSRRHRRRSCSNYDACRIQMYRQSAKEQVHHSSAGGKNQFLAASRKADLPKTVARRLRGGEEDYTHGACCVCPIDQTAPYCPFAMVS
ncbi:hypothetical protein TNCV_4476651 [Trichonephila clavipes]|nr:hypothetical protein TNCV_4476651 [Trichonephila clavipes]